MVDFKIINPGPVGGKPIDPIQLYDTLDRSVEKGPLRPAQDAVLREWYDSRRNEKDVLIKLHTGQGKTLVGLLILQVQLNKNEGPAVYLCPDNQLIDQTCDQARQFGIKTCRTDGDLPDSFLDSKTILVTSIQKLFNGLTRFGLKRNSIRVGALLMDDAHACSDAIREACKIRISSNEPAYAVLRELFATDLEQQGVGTFADLINGSRDAVLPVPYWSWNAHVSDVARILSDHSDKKSIKFAWPLLRDRLRSCQCVFSGVAAEIEPFIAPLEDFGSYANAEHRIFMSATVTDDAFLVKGLKLDPSTITKPISYSKERWSGEKMVLLPALISDALDRATIVRTFGRMVANRTSGVVVLVPGFDWTHDWEKYGARVAKKETVTQELERLKRGSYAETVVLANRYNGIDLPDDTCRVLIFDGKPFSENLIDRNEESCRPTSVTTLMRAIRTVEQGMGRSVRGEKDYSVIVVTGAEVTRLLREKVSRSFLSSQMAMQIEIGLDIASMAQQEIVSGKEPFESFMGLIMQSLRRDDGWKNYYASRMANVLPRGPNETVLKIYTVELQAERGFSQGDYGVATKLIQELLDTVDGSTEDKGWYLQMMARFNYETNRPESERLQLAAHKCNRSLLKPAHGITVTKLNVISQGRVERIIAWVRRFNAYDQLNVAITDILSNLRFGVASDRFENALNELSSALGFGGERPDKEWKEGPDNLWALDDNHYVIWECKNEVELTRSEINKREAEQMNRSMAWFIKHYPGVQSRKLIVHPSYKEGSAASFLHEVEAVRSAELSSLTAAISGFFKSFEGVDLADLSPAHVQSLLDSHKLTVGDFLSRFGKKIKRLV
ncbi:DEAD/DEAH box helicase family protein [Tahibacter soli]|uniref:DEAD/DEAH box helicase family protein n=1 Tax=Tahibacter soli TaxID=2983605 RepID=A0A9X3YTX2_9GAMM|nr:DEAD/DEAH box helicase family protein [Tahibacter soli]MDC8016231.1 DEAD/DEAH box helicase family protein [Tahibacter soli]